MNILLSIIIIAVFTATPAFANDKRYIFDESFTWVTQKGADETLMRIKRAGFNVYVPCVWHGRGVTWDSNMVAIKERSWKTGQNSGKTDPLRYLIDKAHSMGIEVHPWFTVAGRDINFLAEYAPAGTPLRAFDVHNPNFREFIVNLMLEVVRNYDVDGINLDYVRSKGICSSASCSSEYQAQTGRKLEHDVSVVRRNQDAFTFISKWNKDVITDIIRSFHDKAKAVKPNLIISVDSHPLKFDILMEGADSIEWLNNNLIDIIFNMDYFEKPALDVHRKILNKVKKPEAVILLVGNFVLPGKYGEPTSAITKPHSRKTDTVLNLLRLAMEQNHNSHTVALYEYSFMTDEQLDVIGRLFYDN